MSLLLQALKRAEEAKRQREPDAAEVSPAPSLVELAFPTLEDVPPAEPVATSPAEPERIELEFVRAAEISEPSVVAPVATFEIEAPPAKVDAEVVPVPVSADTPQEPVAPVPTPKNASVEAARQLLNAPRAKKPASTLPWLVLGGCVLLGGVAAWFWWQLQQLTTLSPLIAPPEARIPAEASVVASPPEVLTPKTVDQAPRVATKLALAESRPKPAPTIVPSPVARPLSGNAAAYMEAPPNAASQPQIARNVQEAAIPAALEAGWQAYQKGDLTTAENQYRRMLTSDPRNRDAQLGLAAIAVRRGQKLEAIKWYKSLLLQNPQDEDAQVGLLSVDSDNLPERSEARLLQRTERLESAQVLGQHYAARGRWHEAQQQFFDAWSRDPANADLAFNLAISLDHIGQPKLAADFYRKALVLAPGSFDRAAAEKRLAEIRAAQK